MDKTLSYRHRVVTADDIDFIRRLIAEHPGASRWGLSKKLCQAWNWVQANGAPRDMVCRGLMLMLHRQGLIELPPVRRAVRNPLAERGAPALVEVDQAPLRASLAELGPLALRQVRRTRAESVFNSLLRAAPLPGLHPAGGRASEVPGLRRRAADRLCRVGLGARAIWAAATASSAGARGRGWPNVRLLAYNTRFLILPWVRVPHLASHLLGRMARVLSADWQRLYGHPIYFLETFVDPQRFRGTCYRAANWVHLGRTTGRGKDAPTARTQPLDQGRAGLSAGHGLPPAPVLPGAAGGLGMKEPELVSATQAELDEILARAKPALSEQQYRLLEGVFGTFVFVMLTLQNAKTSIKRLQQMLFGARTERKRQVLGAREARRAGEPPEAAGTTDTTDTAAATACGDAGHPDRVAKPAPPPATAATARRPIVTRPSSNARIPTCSRATAAPGAGRARSMTRGPGPSSRWWARRRWRPRGTGCNACAAGCARRSSPLPCPRRVAACQVRQVRPELREHDRVAALTAPHYRLEGLQASLYVPLPDATQWDIISQAVPGPRAAFEELIHQAAQAPLLHNDDTPARVLSLMAERAKAEAAGQTPKAKAIETSGIVAVVAQHDVVLFFTGHAHAGTNLAQVLAHRARELAPPIPMCDALASNIAGEFATILAIAWPTDAGASWRSWSTSPRPAAMCSRCWPRSTNTTRSAAATNSRPSSASRSTSSAAGR